MLDLVPGAREDDLHAAEPGGDGWVELLVTDSLDRPLGDAPYALDRGGERVSGRLSAAGRLAFAMPPEGGADLFLARRTLHLVRGPSCGLAWDRNRLMNLGYDAGPLRAEPDPARVTAALDAFARVTSAPRALARERLEAWYRGLEGVAKHDAGRAMLDFFQRGFFGRWRARRAALRGEPRAGSHLSPGAERGGRRVELAVSTGLPSSVAAQNRIVVFDWFSGYGTPPRPHNLLDVLIDGEAAFARMADDMEAAAGELCVTTWFADPDIELRRPTALAVANPDRRASFRLAAIVEALALRGGRVSILLWNWVMTPIVNHTLRKWALALDDRIEIIQVRHPLLIGSFHQKTMVIDRKIAYCGGFNLRQNDWDTQAHGVGDPRRNPHAASGWERRASEPAYPPRHDIAVRLEGPVVADVHDNFVHQWNVGLRRDRRSLRQFLGRLSVRIFGGGPASPVTPMEVVPEARGAVLVQLVRTEPGKRPSNQAVIDVYLRAIRNARRLIYIENQFFRSPRITAAIARALRMRPALEVVVVTNQIGPPLRVLNGAAHWTREAQETLRAERPGFSLYELLACGEIDGAVAYRPVWLHAKVMVIDDEWVTIGSANINDRSISTEFEANVAIEDARVAKETRRRLMAEHLGLDASDDRLTDPRCAYALWCELSRQNAAARKAHGLALGRAHPFEQAGAWIHGRSEWF